jgi:spermidine synthase
MKKARFLNLLFGLCMFATGASGLVNEYVLATISTYILGNSIEQFSVVIALMLLMMGVAGFVQDKVSDRNLVAKFIAIELLICLLGGFAPLAIYAAFGWIPEHFMLVEYVFVLAIGFLIGFEIPIAMRVIEQHGAKIKLNIKIVYAMDYVGAFVGAIIWVKYLLRSFPLTEISFIVVGFNFLVASVTAVYFLSQGLLRKRILSIASLVVVGGLLSFGFANNREWNIRMEQQFYSDPIVEVKNTRYQHLVLTEEKTTGDIRLYINGNTQFSSIDEKRYHELLVHPVMNLHPSPKHVLILGGGDGLALREVLKFPDVADVMLVDLDPDMIRFASTSPTLRRLNRDSFADARVFIPKSESVGGLRTKGVYLETDRIQKGKVKTERVATVGVYHVDADKFVGELHGKKWDVIIIDFPDPSSVELSKLYSREFYTKLQWLMADGAYVAIQSTSPFHSKEAFLTIRRTLEASGLKTLPYRQNIPSFGDWGYYLVWKSDVSKEEMAGRIRGMSRFRIDTEFMTPEVLSAAFAFGKGELYSKSTDINTLMYPCLLDDYVNKGWVED